MMFLLVALALMASNSTITPGSLLYPYSEVISDTQSYLDKLTVITGYCGDRLLEGQYEILADCEKFHLGFNSHMRDLLNQSGRNITTILLSSQVTPPSIPYSETRNSTDFELTKIGHSGQKTIFGDTASVVGFIRNVGDTAWTSVKLIATFYDKGGNLIAIEEGSPIVPQRMSEPNGISPFEIPKSSNITQMDHYVIEAIGTN